MEWTWDPEWEETLRGACASLRDRPEQLPGYREIKRNNARVVYRFEAGATGFVVKHFKRSTGAARWKERILGTAAAREWARLRFLREHGIPAPRAAAVWSDPSGESGLVTEELAGARPWKEILLQDRAPARVRGWLAAAANLVRLAHAAGFVHADLHVGNFLVDAAGAFHLIDVHRGQVQRRLSLRDRLSNLALLGYSLTTVLPRSAWRRLLDRYLEGPLGVPRAPDPHRCAHWMADEIARLRGRHLRRRTKRCLREGTGFHLEELGGWRVHVTRGIEAATVLRLIVEHDARRSAPRTGPPAVVKDTTRVKLTLERLPTTDGDRAVIVKAFHAPGLRLRLKRALGADPGKRSWVAAHGLRVRGLPTPEALAFVEPVARTDAHSSYLVVAARPAARTLDRYVVERFPAAGRGRVERDRFLRDLADTVRRLHVAGVHHHDLKANNLLVREEDGRWRFELIDLDRVSFAQAVPLSARLGNLAQLNAATPGAITRSDRLRCLRWYAMGSTALGDRREAVARVMRLTLARRHVWPTPRAE